MIQGWDLKHCWKRARAQAARETHFAVADPQSIVSAATQKTDFLYTLPIMSNVSFRILDNHSLQYAPRKTQIRLMNVIVLWRRTKTLYI